MKRILFNGKFYAGDLNGVHRVADRLITEIDALISELPIDQRPQASVILPASAKWRPNLSAISVIEEGGKCGQLWEQLSLPFKARGSVLVNLCNLAPLLHKDKVLLIHDAQFLLPDSSYPWRQRTGYRLLVPWMARTSKLVLTVSNYSRQTLSALGVSPLNKTAVLHNGVDHILASEPRHGAPSQHNLALGKYVMMFGSGKSYKNNRVVFEAFRDARMAEYQLVIVGPDRAALERDGLDVPRQNIVFAGRINDGELRGLLDSALCLVFPSRTEGFGLPPAEAMICGCPVVVTPAGAIPEVCRDAASYADVDDPESWIAAMLKLDHDASYRSAKIEAGRSLMERFTWRSAGESLLKGIVDLARERTAGSLH